MRGARVVEHRAVHGCRHMIEREFAGERTSITSSKRRAVLPNGVQALRFHPQFYP